MLKIEREQQELRALLNWVAKIAITEISQRL